MILGTARFDLARRDQPLQILPGKLATEKLLLQRSELCLRAGELDRICSLGRFKNITERLCVVSLGVVDGHDRLIGR